MYGTDVGDNADYSGIVTERHCARINGLFADAREKGARLCPARL